MFSEEKIDFLDFDIYSRRISFFYKDKEKISSILGFILTIFYVITSIILFLVYYIKTINREEVTASDSTIYPIEIPSIDLNKDLFYLAFGLEDPTNFKRFIDEKIYYPEVILIERIKENGGMVKTSQNVLDLERCNKLNFGKDYQYLFENDDLNNSYCLKDFNLTLMGGFKYDKMSYIRINIYPCINNSLNNHHCKPQNEIDKYLSSGYFSALIKDIGLNPFNYTFPIIPIIQDLYTTIDKYSKKEFIIYFGITEINTDIGLFYTKIKKEIYLKYINDKSNIFYTDNKIYKPQQEIFNCQIRLEDNIHFQKRTYTKMSVVFSTTGGYMQVIYTILTLISLLTKKFSIEKKLINSLFNFNIKERKIILSIEYENKLGYNFSFKKGKENSFIPFIAKKSIVSNKKYIAKRNSIFHFNRNINQNPFLKKSDDEAFSIGKKELRSQNNISEEDFANIFNKIKKEKEQSPHKLNQSININRSKANILNKADLNNIQINRIFEQKRGLKKTFNFTHLLNFKTYEKGNIALINFNIFDYYCFKKLTKKEKEIELFNFGLNFYKRQMDIINFINIILLTEIMLTQQSEKKDMNQTLVLSMN